MKKHAQKQNSQNKFSHQQKTFSKNSQQAKSFDRDQSQNRSVSNRGFSNQNQRANHSSSVGVNKSWRVIAGTHAIKEVIKVRPDSVKLAYVQKSQNQSFDVKEMIDLLKSNRISFEEKSEIELEKFCNGHQGIIVFSDFNPSFDYTVAGWEHNSMVLALDGVEDPHNLGAIMRTSWLMGVNGIIIPQDRAVGLTSTVHKVACGGVEHVSLARMNNFTEPFESLKEAGFWIYGLSHKAKKTIYDIKYPEKVVWVLGAEDKGLRIPTERACDELVSIPQLSADASYNVSVATAIAISETQRQWLEKSK